MTLKEVSYLKQSKNNSHLVLLNSYTSRIGADFSHFLRDNKEYSYSSVNFEKIALPVLVRIVGMSYYSNYEQFSKIFCEKPNLFEEIDELPFPAAVRVINNDTYVIERPPFKTNVRLSLKRAYLSKRSDNSSVLCEIWIPWTVCILKLKDEDFGKPSMKMYYNDGPLSSLDQTVCPPWTPNIHQTGEMCLGDTSVNFDKEVSNGDLNPNNVQEVYNYLINDYFNGGWNMDLGSGLIQNLCAWGVGKFTKDPLGDPELSLRATKNKLKLKVIDDSSRKSTVIKTNYLTWSLLTLSEVLEAVKIYKENYNDYNFNRYNLNTIVQSDKKKYNNENESLKYVAQKMHDYHYGNIKNWEIRLKISSETINKVLLETYSLKDLENMNLVYFGNACVSVANDIIYKDHENIASLINNTLELIADFYLDSNFENNIDPIDIVYNCQKESAIL